MLPRTPEPELMEEEEQARAYALADFAEPHDRFVELFCRCFPDRSDRAWFLDLGCGPADVTLRLAAAHPGCRFHGLDGSAAMLRYGQSALAASGAADRVELFQGYLPGAELPRRRYDVVVSNSLLHHLAAPAVLWESAQHYGEPGTAVFIMDLMRPDSDAEARAMVERYAAGEPEVLRHDFYNSLHAAYTVAEVQGQLAAAGLGHLTVTAVGDRHLTVSGRLGFTGAGH